MAQQKSLNKLEGTIGDLTFYNTKNGYQVRQKTGVSGDRIANDPGFQRTRENNAEFSTACNTSKKMRDLLRPIVLLTSDSKMMLRLNSRISRIVKADTASERGARRALAENLFLLKDFNFNAAAALNNTVFTTYVASVDRAEDSAQISLPEFNPEVAIAKPKGATHFQLNAAAAVLDLKDEGSGIVTVASDYLPLNSIAPLQTLNMPGIHAQSFPVMLVFGISFYQEVNGVNYSLNNGAYNAIAIASIDLP